MTSKLILRLYYTLGAAMFLAHQPAYAQQNGVQLLEPVGGCSKLTTSPGLGLFFKYFNLLWPILIGSAAGMSVLMAVVGGLQIIMSGGDTGKRQEGIDRFTNALMGLLMCAFAGLILRTLNPSFFKAGSVGSGGC